MKRTPAVENENGTIVGEVQKGIKVPEARIRSGVKYPFDRMKIGDSFTVSNPKKKETILRNTIYGAILNFRKKNPQKYFIVRKIGDHEYRVWRTSVPIKQEGADDED